MSTTSSSPGPISHNKMGQTCNLRSILKLVSLLIPRVPNPPRITSTSCLHGLRGLGACTIFTRHLLISFWDFPDHGYTGNERPGSIQELLIRFPVFRAPFAGNATVVVFIVISGYLDSIKPLLLIQDGKWEPLQRHLATSMFRRPLRLFLPALIACILIAIAVWLGLYDWGEEYRSIFFASKGDRLMRQSNLFLQLRDVLVSFAQLLDLTRVEPVLPDVNIHLWTLPVELRCSFLRYSTLLCLSRLRLQVRIALLLFVIAYFFVLGRWEYTMTLCGVLLCQVDVARSHHNAKGRASMKPSAGHMHLGIYPVLLVLGSYFCLFPKENGASTPGFITLSRFAPAHWQDYRYYNSWAALILIHSALHFTPFTWLLNQRIPQYLGSLSFSIYLLHGPTLHISAFPLITMMWFRWKIGMVIGFLMPSVCVVGPVVLMAASLFERLVERRVYRLIQGLQDAVMIQDEKDERVKEL